MYDGVLQVFPDELWKTFAPQQHNLANNAMDRVLKKDGPEALTLDRLEGIKELVTQHPWSPALTEASKMLATHSDGEIKLGFHFFREVRQFPKTPS